MHLTTIFRRSRALYSPTVILFSLGLVVLALSASPSHAEEAYPNKPLTIVVGFGIGGSADRMARLIAPKLAEQLGQPVQVINKQGAGTLLAAKHVLSRPSDGYSIFASTFSPYLLNTVLNGSADYTVADFSYINFNWFDEDLIALSKRSRYKSFEELLQAIRDKPKTVRASVVKGSAGHLMAKLILDIAGIPQENLNLVAYNSGGKARAAVAGGVVDFMVISAKGSESISEYLKPLAIISDEPNESWQVPTLNQLLKEMDLEAPILPGSLRGFATAAEFKRSYPQRYATLAAALKATLADPQVRELLTQSDIGFRWIGPQVADQLMAENYAIFDRYAYLLNWGS